MNTKMQTDLARQCQIAIIPHLGQPITDLEMGARLLPSRLKLYLKRILSPKIKRMLKMRYDGLVLWLQKAAGTGVKPVFQEALAVSCAFKAGDMVRIRSKEEIVATLNSWGELKGCGFMAGMEQYCGTVQRVWKTVQRFVDERDYKVKKTRGIYILEGLNCQGTGVYGRCDRSCFFFWREEWLEKIS